MNKGLLYKSAPIVIGANKVEQRMNAGNPEKIWAGKKNKKGL